MVDNFTPFLLENLNSWLLFLENKFQEDKCKDVINIMVQCCMQDRARELPRCSGFKKIIQNLKNEEKWNLHLISLKRKWWSWYNHAVIILTYISKLIKWVYTVYNILRPWKNNMLALHDFWVMGLTYRFCQLPYHTQSLSN